MRYFFIDLENVRNEGLEGVLSLNEKDMVYIFYSENAFSMAIPTMESITNSKCSSKFIKTNYIGKNAMDFQIVSLFGAMIERCREGSFYIISKDNGFRSAVSFCESFFSEYPIKCGVYPRIISALAVETKNRKESDTEETEEKKTSSKRSRRRNRKPAAEVETNENEAKQNKNTADNTADKQNGKAEGKPAEAQNKKASGKPAETKNKNDQDKKPAESQGENKPAGKFDYIYNLLKVYLSERTIEIYAGCIDEGIAKSNNREELQKFFWESLGEDEGEALFKVVRSDYEKYKQNRPKKSSRTRRRRNKKNDNQQ